MARNYCGMNSTEIIALEAIRHYCWTSEPKSSLTLLNDRQMIDHVRILECWLGRYRRGLAATSSQLHPRSDVRSN
jgi:hypothetical protein